MSFNSISAYVIQSRFLVSYLGHVINQQVTHSLIHPTISTGSLLYTRNVLGTVDTELNKVFFFKCLYFIVSIFTAIALAKPMVLVSKPLTPNSFLDSLTDFLQFIIPRGLE